MYLKSRNCLQELHQRHTMCIGEPRSRQNSLQKGDSEAHHSDTSTADRIMWRTHSSGVCTITHPRRFLLFTQILYLIGLSNDRASLYVTIQCLYASVTF